MCCAGGELAREQVLYSAGRLALLAATICTALGVHAATQAKMMTIDFPDPALVVERWWQVGLLSQAVVRLRDSA